MVHALIVEIWQLQRQTLLASSATPQALEGGLSFSVTAQTNQTYNSINAALGRWKHAWDEDYALQYPRGDGYRSGPKRVGFCRDGVHFYWLARAILQPNRIPDWQLGADQKLGQVLHDLQRAREWSRTDGAQRGEEPGSVAYIDDDYASSTLELDMKKLFRPLQSLSDSPLPATQRYQSRFS